MTSRTMKMVASHVWSFVGDSMGWFHSCSTTCQNQTTTAVIQPKFNLSSEPCTAHAP
ncbi:hypothetical protein PISMIDRAFT_466467 [Pisolithus microcarpus 441]|uniref:Unplaced genomic scaffold scaffold_44, whole genome shotgun sequence n=1 Tax=Pisolithus microcarpus 441 TaxID=765257 RepID=A0A0C9Z2L2_9AGAM|nr:hypothetical protein PISMIDRAFT_466467 [Pisolithus microcarpus 441]